MKILLLLLLKVVFLYKYKKKCLPPLKTTVFQGFYSRAARDDVTWSYSSAQKRTHPHPGTQILSQIPERGEGKRGQMPHIFQGSPPPSPPSPLGLTLIDP